MDFRLLFAGIGLFIVSSCGSVTGGDTEYEGTAGENDNLHKLTVSVSEYRPHCGGMAPTPEMEANITRPGNGMVYYLYEDSRPTNKSDFTKVTANNAGIIELELKPGNYSMITEDKMLPLDEFLAIHKVEGIHYSSQENSCYEEWKNAANFNVELVSDTTMQIQINHRCFTGINPCLQYTGPHPP